MQGALCQSGSDLEPNTRLTTQSTNVQHTQSDLGRSLMQLHHFQYGSNQSQLSTGVHSTNRSQLKRHPSLRHSYTNDCASALTLSPEFVGVPERRQMCSSVQAYQYAELCCVSNLSWYLQLTCTVACFSAASYIVSYLT